MKKKWLKTNQIRAQNLNVCVDWMVWIFLLCCFHHSSYVLNPVLNLNSEEWVSMITLSTTIWRRKEEHFSFVRHQIIAALPQHHRRVGNFQPFEFFYLIRSTVLIGAGACVPFGGNFIWIYIAIASSSKCQVQIFRLCTLRLSNWPKRYTSVL